jgi:hypothetical protein
VYRATLLSDFEVLSALNVGFKYGSAVERGISMANRRSVSLSAHWDSQRGISICEITEVHHTIYGAKPSATENSRSPISELRQEGMSTCTLWKKSTILVVISPKEDTESSDPSSSKCSMSVSLGETTTHGEEENI